MFCNDKIEELKKEVREIKEQLCPSQSEELKKEIEKVKKEIFPKKKECDSGDSMTFLNRLWFGSSYSEPTPLADRVSSLEEKLDLLLKHLKLEKKTTEKKVFLGKVKTK